jgi:hypothetical protein
LTVSKDLKLKKVRPVIKFDNRRLSNILFTTLKNTSTVFHKTLKEIPSKTTMLLIFFYYPPELGDKSFISVFNF